MIQLVWGMGSVLWGEGGTGGEGVSMGYSLYVVYVDVTPLCVYAIDGYQLVVCVCVLLCSVCRGEGYPWLYITPIHPCA